MWKCPPCNDLRAFSLISRNGGVALLANIFSPHRMLDLACGQCGYEFRVPVAERAVVEQMREATAELRLGKMSAEAYRKFIATLPARFVKQIVALTTVWICSKCGEDNPMTFTSCWKCQSQGAITTVEL